MAPRSWWLQAHPPACGVQPVRRGRASSHYRKVQRVFFVLGVLPERAAPRRERSAPRLERRTFCVDHSSGSQRRKLARCRRALSHDRSATRPRKNESSHIRLRRSASSFFRRFATPRRTTETDGRVGYEDSGFLEGFGGAAGSSRGSQEILKIDIII